MVPVPTAGTTAGQLTAARLCTETRKGMCFRFLRSKTKSCLSTSGKSSLAKMSCLTKLEPLKQQLRVSSEASAKPTLKASAKQC